MGRTYRPSPWSSILVARSGAVGTEYTLKSIPSVFNLVLVGGDTFVKQITFPFSIINDEITASVVQQDGDEFEMGILVVDAPGGKFQISLTAAQTLALRGTINRWTLVWESNGEIKTILSGTCEVQ
jgi:hypothetical protein